MSNQPRSRFLFNLLVMLTLLFTLWPSNAVATAPSAQAVPAPKPNAPISHSPNDNHPLLPGGSTISGTLTTDDVWGAGTITVTGDIFINPGVTIVITPGTTIQMATTDAANLGDDDARVEFMVGGALQVNGPVTFTSQSATPACADWVGIHFQASSQGYLDTALIEWGVHAVEIATTNNLTIANSDLRFNCHQPASGSAWGAGMDIQTGAHLISNTAIYSNSVTAGLGGGWAEGGGVQITPGAGPSLFQNCRIYDNLAENPNGGEDAAGGGLNVLQADPILRHCEIYNNRVIALGRAFGGGVNLDNSSGIIEGDSHIHDNALNAGSGNGYGGGVSIGQAPPAMPIPAIRDSRIVSNTCQSNSNHCYGGGIGFADWPGGGHTETDVSGNLIAHNVSRTDQVWHIACGGGVGMASSTRIYRIDSNVIRDNAAFSNSGGALGGGVCLHLNNVVSVTNNLLFNNRVHVEGTPGSAGGGAYVDAPDAYLSNNTVVSNTASGTGVFVNGDGGGVCLLNGHLYNSVIVSNTADNQGGGVYLSIDSFADYNDVWDNQPNDYNIGATPPANDISMDPLFRMNGDLADLYHLHPASPCIDVGAGPGSGIPNHDFDSQSRPQDAAWDIGFDEVSSLSFQKQVSAANAEPGDLLTYTIIFSDPDGLVPLVGVWISDALPANTSWHSGPTCSLPSCGYLTDTVWWNGNVPTNTALTLWYTVAVDYGLAYGTQISNSAYYTIGNLGIGGWSNVVTTTIHTPLFTLTKQSDGDFVIGRAFTYTVIVSNVSPTTAGEGVVVTDALPLGGHYVSGGSYADGVVSLNYPTISANQTATATWMVSTCQTSLVNQWYRVITSTTRVKSGWGPVLNTPLTPPNLSADFAVSSDVVGVGQVVTFTDQSSTDGGALTAWRWDLGDGQIDSGALVTHAYTAEGSYTVTLQITDSCGFTGSHSVVNAVSVVSGCIELASVNIQGPTTGITGTYAFTASYAPAAATPPISYTWDTGEHTAHLTHTWALTGTYTLTVSASNCDGAAVTDTHQIMISAEPITCTPLSAISIQGESSGYPDVYTFTTSYEPPDATAPINYFWDNTGTISMGGVSVRSLGVGTHTLMVTATNCMDALVTDIHQIIISQPITTCTQVSATDFSLLTSGDIYSGAAVIFGADISPDEAAPDYNYRYTVNGGLQGGQGVVSSEPFSFTHTFDAIGVYQVLLEVWNCSMPITQAVSATLSLEVVNAPPSNMIYLPIVIKRD